MKGLVFTEFLEQVEEKHGLKLLNELIDEAELPNHGSYTSIGYYDHRELRTLIEILSRKSDVSMEEILVDFGRYFFSVLMKSHSDIVKQVNLFDFLESVHKYIHPEVKKIYPKSELPSFSVERSENKLEMTYHSARAMSDFAVGLIKGAADFYKEDITVKVEKLSEEGQKALIIIDRN